MTVIRDDARPPDFPIRVIRGDRYALSVRARYQDDSDVDLSSASVEAQIIPQGEESTAIANMTPNISGSSCSPTLDETASNGLTIGNYHWGLGIDVGSGRKQILGGPFKVERRGFARPATESTFVGKTVVVTINTRGEPVAIQFGETAPLIPLTIDGGTATVSTPDVIDGGSA